MLIYKHFEQIFLEVLNTHVPIKRKLLRANHKYVKIKQMKTLSLMKNRGISAVNDIKKEKILLNAWLKQYDW